MPFIPACCGADETAVLQVSLSAFAFLFSELVQYCQVKVTNVGELERRSGLHTLCHLAGPARAASDGCCCRLEDAGTGVGLRLVELLCFREKTSRRETRLLDALKFVHSVLWKYLFGRQARDLEQSNMVRL